MNKLAEFMGGDKPEPAGMELEVDVCCQICFEYVDGATYYPVEKLLKWKCSKDHISFIEEFRL